MAEEIDSHVDRAAKIINHLRDFGRKSDVSKEPVRVNDPLNRAHEMFDQQLRIRDIKVIKDLQEDIPLILADPNRLEQVFINLLINARDAIEERQEREGRRANPKEIRLSSRCEMGKVHIEVSDTGNGIPDTIRDRIFEPFFTTKKVGQGTGLGLSISYGIVQDYHGTIRVETMPNTGSKFILEFPMRDSEEAGSA
jgi:histidine kinase